MSTDARPNGSDDDRTSRLDEGVDDPEREVTSEGVDEPGPATSSEPAPAAGPLDAAAAPAAEPVSESTPPAADRSLDETHVAAIPAQRRDGFEEVDGGDTVPPERTEYVPTEDEDEALREERARRFGRPRPEPVETSTEPEERTTAAVPLAAAGAGAVATVGEPAEESGTTRTMPTTTGRTATEGGEDDPFKDFDDGPSSRAAAHWWSLLIAIVFVPVGWYLVTDGGERLNFNLVNGGPFNIAAPIELAAGVLCLFFVLLATRWSSVGAIVVGTVGALAGIAFIVFHEQAMELITEYQGVLVQGLRQLGQNVVDHLVADLRTGRTAVYGIVLIMAGVISHGARRQGRREERRRAALGA